MADKYPIILLILNAASTWYMVGLIWMVQLVHYPLFSKVGTDNYDTYQRLHQYLTTIAVGPAMLVEAFTAVLLVTYRPANVSVKLVLIGFVLILAIWLSTAFLQVPCHGKLEKGFDESVHRFLVNSNWIRTFAWTLRGALVAWMVWLVMGSLDQAA